MLAKEIVQTPKGGVTPVPSHQHGGRTDSAVGKGAEPSCPPCSSPGCLFPGYVIWQHCLLGSRGLWHPPHRVGMRTRSVTAGEVPREGLAAGEPWRRWWLSLLQKADRWVLCDGDRGPAEETQRKVSSAWESFQQTDEIRP